MRVENAAPGQVDPAVLELEGALAARVRFPSLSMEHREKSERIDTERDALAQLDPQVLDVDGAFAARARFPSLSVEHREKSERIAIEDAAPVQLDSAVVEVEELELQGALAEGVRFLLQRGARIAPNRAVLRPGEARCGAKPRRQEPGVLEGQIDRQRTPRHVRQTGETGAIPCKLASAVMTSAPPLLTTQIPNGVPSRLAFGRSPLRGEAPPPGLLSLGRPDRSANEATTRTTNRRNRRNRRNILQTRHGRHNLGASHC
jgi:hypothetical protein